MMVVVLPARLSQVGLAQEEHLLASILVLKPVEMVTITETMLVMMVIHWMVTVAVRLAQLRLVIPVVVVVYLYLMYV